MKAKACLRIATRKSPLAYWQANFIKQQLSKDEEFLALPVEEQKEAVEAIYDDIGENYKIVYKKYLDLPETNHSLN